MAQSWGSLVCNSAKTALTHTQTTIGRLSTNVIPINDPTVSKQHASIYCHNRKFSIQDHNTVNGTYINGNRLESNQKYPLKHKDSIQFGKHPQLFSFFQSGADQQKKGKINLKDYCFELDSEESQEEAPKVKPMGSDIKQQPKGKALKIPELADYLQLSGSVMSSNPSQLPVSHFEQPSKVSEVKPGPSLPPRPSAHGKTRDQKVSLDGLAQQFDPSQLSKVRKQEQNRKNLFIAKEQQNKRREMEALRIEQEKLRLQVERAKQEEQLIRQQLQLEERVQRQQQEMDAQRHRIENQMLLRQEQRRKREAQMEEIQREKERKYKEELEYKKQEEVRQARAEQELQRTQSEAVMKEDFERKKKELEIEAQALAQQYETIYRDTIRKMRNDIERQEEEVNRLRQSSNDLNSQNADLQQKVSRVAEAVEAVRKELAQVSGRNKAFILYASQLQSRLDKLKAEQVAEQPSAKLKDEVNNSRKLLAMKRNQAKALTDETLKLRLSLTGQKRANIIDQLETILENHEAIQSGKSVYFQYLKEQKALQQVWSNQLNDNQQLKEANLTLSRQLASLRAQILQDSSEHANRLTEQRLYMLRGLHYMAEDKKRAAKFLIEQMTATEQQISGLLRESEESHRKIHELIVDSARRRQENEYISSLLFGADVSAHHFDNMKIEINGLMEKAAVLKDEGRVGRRVKAAEEVESIEVALVEAARQLKAVKNKWREGVAGRKMVTVENNPIVFFGGLLAQKETQLEACQGRIATLQRQGQSIAMQTGQLQKRKEYLGSNLQSFKREELEKVRASLV